MNFKNLLQSIREMNAALGPKGNRPSVEAAYKKVRKAAKKQVASERGPGPEEDSLDWAGSAQRFLKQGKGPAKKA